MNPEGDRANVFWAIQSAAGTSTDVLEFDPDFARCTAGDPYRPECRMLLTIRTVRPQFAIGVAFEKLVLTISEPFELAM